ncbi:MAG: hypothetical protein EOO74_06050 [Myxococcales bacterium]|nr:MAG: hypothetical protein EOO74_06050 [Myxococcales bacterium]
MTSQYPQALLAIRTLQTHLAQLAGQDEGLVARLRRGDPSALGRLVHEACAQVGIPFRDYQREIESNPDLIQLEQKAIDEGLIGTADPGPYDAISRESPTGREGDLSKPRIEGDADDETLEPRIGGA